MSIELRPASSLSLAGRTALFNAGYEEYVIPMRLDETALKWMVDSFDIDLDASRVATRDGEPVGFANLALRGDEAWVGGVGVIPAARRTGIGETLMRALHDEARARGVATIRLEVIEQNESAYRLYEKLGYDLVRWVEVWTLPAETGAGSAREVPVEQAHSRIRSLRGTREPWQRADATLAHYADARGLETDAGAAIFRVAGCRADRPDRRRRNGAVADRPVLGDVIILNLPAEDPAAAALRELGGSVTVRQREMALYIQGQD